MYIQQKQNLSPSKIACRTPENVVSDPRLGTTVVNERFTMTDVAQIVYVYHEIESR